MDITTLIGFQLLNKQIYTKQDDRHFEKMDLALKLLRYATRTLKGIRKGNEQVIAQNLLISLS